LLAAQWRKGRVFLAGDAAHQQPPFIGQGMCQGVRDVTNLCWKLSEVMSGFSGDALLDIYEQERSQHVHTLTSRIKTIGHHICERDPTAARERDAALLRQGGGRAPTVTRQEIVPPLATGLLDDSPYPAIGTLFPQPWITTANGTVHMDILAGHGWRLFLDGRNLSAQRADAMKGPTGRSVNVIRVGGDGLQERDSILAAWFDRHECMAVIVRPDHYVYGVARTMQDATEMLRALQRNDWPATRLSPNNGQCSKNSAAPACQGRNSN
jgi:3-(3-hydroxy-phenyl)propionate hydroxylase